MSRKKKITVENILSIMDGEQAVIVDVYAYGISYANSWRDGFRTVDDCLNGIRKDILLATVCDVRATQDAVRILTDLTA